MSGLDFRRASIVFAVFALTTLGSASAAWAQPGFDQYQSTGIGVGARAMGMGGAFVAVADDATAASWNPAGLAMLRDPEVSFVQSFSRQALRVAASSNTNLRNGAPLSSSASAAAEYSYSANGPDFVSIVYPFAAGRMKFVPQFSYRRPLRNDSSARASAFNTTTTPAGTATTTENAREIEASGGTDVYAATFALSWDPRFHVGVSVNRWGGDDRRVITSQAFVGSSPLSTNIQTLSASVAGTSVDVGLLVAPTSAFSIGVAYKSGFTLDRTTLSDSQTTFASTPIGRYQTGFVRDETGLVKWPATVAIGGSVRPRQTLVLAADYTFTGWSDATFVGTGSTTQSFAGGLPATVVQTAPIDRTYPLASIEGRPQQDSTQFRAGGEFILLKPRGRFVGFPLRGGFYRDRSLQPQLDGSPQIGVGVSGGVGLIWRQISVDVGVVRERLSGTISSNTVRETTTNTVLSTTPGDPNTTVGYRMFLSTTFRLATR